MRAFLAFPLPETAKAAFRPVIEEGRERFPSIRWVRPTNLHITLLFLGDIDGETERLTREVCARAAEHHPVISAEFSGIGQFPPKGKPRVVFSPVTEGRAACSRIYGELFPLFRDRFSLRDTPYSPHITVGRARKGKKARSLTEKDFNRPLRGKMTIPRIILYQSVLHSGGPVYNEITSFELQS